MLPRTVQTKDGRQLILREAQTRDAAALAAATDAVCRERRYFLRSRFQQDVDVEREFIANARRNGHLVLVATLDGALAGWVTLMRQNQEYRRHVLELGMGVLAAYRGIGVGKALVATALDWAAQSGAERVELLVRGSNATARRLYAQMGFVEEGCRMRAVKDDLGEYDDLVLMAYDLRSGSKDRL